MSWNGHGGRGIVGRLRCGRAGGCGRGKRALLRLHRIVFTLRDLIGPTIGVGGPLADDGSRRGTQALDAVVADDGAGVRQVTVDVNGRTVGSRAMPCALSGVVGLRLQPCPASASPSFSLSTAESPFRQGVNSVRACARDFAGSRRANRNCTHRVVRVDNLCPVSASSAADLTAHVAGPGRVLQGTSPRLWGDLRDKGGQPVGGAEVCVASTVRMRGAWERVAATPRTDSSGRWSVRLPAGPNRRLRIAHWPSADHALERYRRVEVQARPRLSASPHKPIRNGRSAHFTVKLAGPAREGRHVTVQASAGRRWFKVRGGRTNARGVYRTAYRFHGTTRKRTYLFRAFVPTQHGYPYHGGHSRTARVKVKPRRGPRRRH